MHHAEINKRRLGQCTLLFQFCRYSSDLFTCEKLRDGELSGAFENILVPTINIVSHRMITESLSEVYKRAAASDAAQSNVNSWKLVRVREVRI